MHRLILILSGLPLLLSPAAVAESPQPGRGQLGKEPELVAVPGSEDEFLLIQKSARGELFLTPNEAFFPDRGLRAVGSGNIPDLLNLNGGNSYAAIEGWNEGERAEWGLFFSSPGEFEVRWETEGRASFSLALGDGEPKPMQGDAVGFTVSEPGPHSLFLQCDRAAAGARVSHLQLRGPGLEQAGVIRKRWRPAAAHTKFSSSRGPEKIRLWIMEMDAVPGDLDFYCPITTPFGYYGPTWKADGTVNTGFNFSLWSFGRGASEPPVEQLSHLLAIGNPDAKFGGFDHEGTGVKIRNWEPLEGRAGQRQVIALRVEPGDTYDTYFSYFYASDEKRWRLFGAGNKWNKGKPISSLWVGSFVEVPGPPPVQRTGPYPRTMRYRGWVVDESGALSPLDQMANGNVDRETGLTHTDRGTTEEGWFYLTTGGWTLRRPPADGETIPLKDPPRGQTPFLEPESLAFLLSVPSSIEPTGLERRGGKARISFEVRAPGDSPEAVLYFGPNEGLTLADRWPHRVKLPDPVEGKNQFVFDDPLPDGPLHVRLYLRNGEGQFWSSETIREPSSD